MKLVVASLFSLVISTGVVYAEGESAAPDILNAIDRDSIEYLETDERAETRGEVFVPSGTESALTKADNWCLNRGVCFTNVWSVFAVAVDPKIDGSVIVKSY